MTLKNKVALVTGGASGIGRAIAHRFLREGAKVMMVDRNAKQGEMVAGEMKKLGPARFFQANVGREAEVANALRACKRWAKRIDVVVNNAGVWGEEPLSKLTEKEFDRVFRVNVKGVLWGMKQALPYLRRPVARAKVHGKSAVINIASVAGLMAEEGWMAYDVSKASVIMATRVAALEYGKHGIRVNAIAPGAIATPMFFRGPVPKKLAPDPWVKSLPIPRLGRPEDVAALAAFLASDDADYITGACYTIDGGAMAGWL